MYATNPNFGWMHAIKLHVHTTDDRPLKRAQLNKAKHGNAKLACEHLKFLLHIKTYCSSCVTYSLGNPGLLPTLVVQLLSSPWKFPILFYGKKKNYITSVWLRGRLVTAVSKARDHNFFLRLSCITQNWLASENLEFSAEAWTSHRHPTLLGYTH